MGVSAFLTLANNLLVAFGSDAARASSRVMEMLPPERGACSLAPRSIDEVVALGGTTPPPPKDPPGGPYFPVHVPVSEPADPATAAEVTSAMTTLANCLASGDTTRALSGLTDDYLGRIVDHDGADGLRVDFERGPRRPYVMSPWAPVGEPLVGRFDDGRVVIRRTLGPETLPRDPRVGSVEVAFILSKAGDHWLLDDFGFIATG